MVKQEITARTTALPASILPSAGDKITWYYYKCK